MVNYLTKFNVLCNMRIFYFIINYGKSEDTCDISLTTDVDTCTEL